MCGSVIAADRAVGQRDLCTEIRDAATTTTVRSRNAGSCIAADRAVDQRGNTIVSNAAAFRRRIAADRGVHERQRPAVKDAATTETIATADRRLLEGEVAWSSHPQDVEGGRTGVTSDRGAIALDGQGAGYDRQADRAGSVTFMGNSKRESVIGRQEDGVCAAACRAVPRGSGRRHSH